MFYQLTMPQEFVERIRIYWGEIIHPPGLDNVKYRSWFVELQERLFFKQPLPHCEVYKATFLPKWTFPECVFLDIRKGECPDVIPSNGPIVSEKVRKIIENVDNFSHQFFPVKLVDERGYSVVQQPYYHMVVRRKIEVERSISDLTKRRQGSYSYGNNCQEELIDKLVYIEHQPELRRFIETLPLWQFKGTYLGFFINQELYDLLKKANVTGIEQYGEKNTSVPTITAI